MLIGKNGGGGQNRHLITPIHGLEGGSHGHLGLAEPDVTAQQAIHRLLPLEIQLDRGNGLQLVIRLLEFESGIELCLEIGVRRHDSGLCQMTFGVVAQKVASQLAQPLPDALLGARPRAAPQLVEPWGDSLDTAVLLYEIEMREGEEEVAVPFVGDLHDLDLSQAVFGPKRYQRWRQLLPHPFLLSDRAQAHELPDSVIGMHDKIARPQVTQTRDKGSKPPARSRALGRQASE